MSLIDDNVITRNTKSLFSLNVFHLMTSMREEKMT